jgi:hypothetical protein
MVKKLPYKEGTWFAIPLRQGGYAVGRVARHSGKGVVLGYFFGPKREAVPTLDELDELSPASAIRVLRFGDLGMIEDVWPIIGNSPDWEREEWPTPAFIRRDDIGRVAWRVVYDDDNPSKVLSEERIPYDSAGYERSALAGAAAAEVIISGLLP